MRRRWRLLQVWRNKMEKYDVFICHNSKDKPEVGKIKSSLQSQGINTFYDEDNLIPFKEWEKQILDSISEVKAFLVFISNNGTGNIQHEEIDFFFKEVLPKKPEIKTGLVILPNTGAGIISTVKNTFPKLLDNHYCDFRKEETNPMNKLIWGITGIYPESQSIITQPKSLTKTPQQPPHADSISLEGIDYRELTELLSESKWEDAWENANYLTYKLMLNAVGKTQGDQLTKEDVKDFPCTDLYKIDKLWVEHSNGKFGFSIQKEIYLSVGGKPDGIFNQSIWRKFSDLVGWVGKDANGCNFFYDSEEEFTFDISAHKGHLPVLIEDYQEIIIDIFARIEACPQFNKDPLKLLNSHLGFQPDTSAIKAVEIINSLPNI